MFSALEKRCRTQYGYGAFPDVRDPNRSPEDRMERCALGSERRGFGL